MMIRIGDEVKVVFSQDWHIWGEVVHVPAYQGDNWIIAAEDARGVAETYSIQQCAYVLKRDKP